MRTQQKLKQLQMKKMRERGKTWGQIALKFKMDKANARRSVLRCIGTEDMCNKAEKAGVEVIRVK